ncbi:MAG: sigma-70 family RNA polymerase sigma factor [Candidatus Hydrogenedentes bacterium]|nr:sigma-70 family RNA polymerase sigma factor [Candidatus Hydrogenedentota bacterium]
MSIPIEARLFYDHAAVEEEPVENQPPPRNATDQELVARAQSGESQAFEELVRRYRNDVYGLSYHFLRDREEAWDVSQEVFIKAFRSLGRFRGDAGIKTWLLRIAANHCKDHFKKRRLPTVSMDAMPTQDLFPARSDPAKDLANTELGMAIQRALDGISPKHRMAFVLRELEGLSYKEMAEVMNCSEGTVMSRLHHARKKLQNKLAAMGYVEGG